MDESPAETPQPEPAQLDQVLATMVNHVATVTHYEQTLVAHQPPSAPTLL